MKNASQRLFLTLFSLLIILSFNACKKDLFDDLPENGQSGQDQIQAFENPDPPSGPGKTVLGAKLNNPYAKTNIEMAYQTIYGTAQSMTPTHLYIRVKPENRAQAELLDSLDLELEDQPLDYEVTYQGEYYKDDDLPEEESPWFYTAVPANFNFPAVPYEVLEEMIIPNYNYYLTFKAFQLSGNEDRYDGLSDDGCHEGCLNWPECAANDVDCGDVNACEPGSPIYPCCNPEYAEVLAECQGSDDCNTASPDWPECAEPAQNSCGCSFGDPTPTRHVSGRVTVEDTVLDPAGTAETEGVRFVKVRAKRKGAFSFIWHSDYTDTNGCYHIEHNFDCNRVKVRVKFKGPYMKIKALNQSAGIISYKSKPIIFDGPNYSGSCVRFLRGGNFTIQTRDWQAATAVNTVAEFHDWELPLPDQSLNLWIDRNNAGAPVLGPANNVAACNNIQLNDGTTLDNSQFVTNLIGNVLSLGAHYSSWYLPDIVMRDIPDSDWYRFTLYHELAHVSQYSLVGECYWRQVRAHEVFMSAATSLDPDQEEDPYGDPTDMPDPFPLYTNFPIVSLTESWGEHVGALYTSRKYTSAPVSILNSINWEEFLEFRLSLENNFIPEGLHWDLIDGINPNDGSTVGDGILINDNAGGATLLELHLLLDNDIFGFRDDVINSTSASGDVLPLFNEYGY